MPARPLRVKIKNELGIPTTLPVGEQYLHLAGSGAELLICGLGPDPGATASMIPTTDRIFWIEAPEFSIQMPEEWRSQIPAHWTELSLQEAQMRPPCRTLTYTPGLRLFPSFWNPLLGRRRLQVPLNANRQILLPSPANTLITPELGRAARKLGLEPVFLPEPLHADTLLKILETARPELFLSVNFHGLDAYGQNQALLEAASVPTVVWCVDNPFHLLSSQKHHLWKRLILAVTDDWFLEPLRRLGANPIHLPLATDPEIFTPSGFCPNGKDITFVGRSRFPERDSFFAACRISPTVMAEAMTLSRDAHFGWWLDKLQIEQAWPGSVVRTAGLGAEKCSENWRQHSLATIAAQTETTIYGDSEWSILVPQAQLHSPVDYYSGLPKIYRNASFSINLTSLLLPHGLTQRHFDVWACGGFLLTDNTPGLSIFPDELRKAICFAAPEEAVEMLDYLHSCPDKKDRIRSAWNELILAEHTYVYRLRQLLTLVSGTFSSKTKKPSETGGPS